MGRDKATILVPSAIGSDRVPMIRRIYDVVARCQNHDTSLANRIQIVTPWAERYRSLLPADCHFIPELQPDRGPLMGFRQGLAEVSAVWVLLLACDLPNLSTPVLQAWSDRLSSLPADTIAYLPKQLDKGWEPLCGFYRRSCLDSLIEYTDRGGRSFQGWLANCTVTELTVADRRYLANCNTPADLAAVAEERSIELH
jgi:molybdenum cofactor guanylyltransferase